MKTVQLEVPMDEYLYERMRYACEKAKKSVGKTLEKILRSKVAPTSTAKEP